jgi:hypothetical protein
MGISNLTLGVYLETALRYQCVATLEKIVTQRGGALETKPNCPKVGRLQAPACRFLGAFMKVNEILKLHGNINRIVEMDAAGCGVNTIAGLFMDNGININAGDVSSLLKATNELTKKSLPKAEVAKLINQQNHGGIQLAI